MSCLLIAVVLVNLPNFFWELPGYGNFLDVSEYIIRLVQLFLFSTCFLMLFKQLKWAWLALWILCLWWQPLAVAVRVFSGVPITSSLVGTTLATSPSELQSLLSILPWSLLTYFVVWNGFCYWVFLFLNKRHNWVWGKDLRIKALFFCVSLLAMPYLFYSQFLPSNTDAQQEATEVRLLDQHAKADQLSWGYTYFPEAFPYELPLAIQRYRTTRSLINALRQNLRLPEPPFSISADDTYADVLVLVIGESSTRNAWRVFNEEAPASTPKLSLRTANNESLITFTDVLAPSIATRQMVPTLVAPEPLIKPDGSDNPQAALSMISVAQKAGYATAWFSNQSAVGVHDGIITNYANEAEKTAFLNPASYKKQGSYDEVLLPPFKRHLALNNRAFIVLHTMGSHFNYQHRYPAGTGPFVSPENEREHYYNSVAYTDYLLDQIIIELAQLGRRSALFYISDHGEAVPQESCAVGSGNRRTSQAYEVPALAWLSDEYIAGAPHVLKQLLKQRHTQADSTMVPGTLLQLFKGGDNAKDDISSFFRPDIKGSSVHVKFIEQLNKNECSVTL